MRRITAIAKTFERPECLRRMLDSLREFYPDLLVLVADDSEKPGHILEPNVKVYPLPYDTGLSAGRNYLVDRVQTEFTLLLDDDFIFTSRTNLDRLVELLDRDADLDIIGGNVWNRPTGWWNFAGMLRDGPNRQLITRGEFGEERDGYKICDAIPNFFLARTDRLRLVEWDPALKISEHMDFFARARGILKVGFCGEAVTIDHDRRGASLKYAKMRGRSNQFFWLYVRKCMARFAGKDPDEVTLANMGPASQLRKRGTTPQKKPRRIHPIAPVTVGRRR